jgi:uncharacterized protein YggE
MMIHKAPAVFGLATTLLLAGGVLAAQSGGAPQRQTVRTTGEALVTARPDRAVIDIGVVTQATTAEAAASQNASQVTTVLAKLKSAAGSAGEVKTISYSVSPNYRYPREGGQPTITGYTATNTVQVTINDLALVGKIVDAATQSGANSVQRLQFSLRDDQAVRALALQQAALQARASAEALAGSLKLRVLRVLSVEEASPPIVRPMMEMARAAAMSAPTPTPVETGSIDVRATVHLTVEVE